MAASRGGERWREIYCINPKAMGVVDTAIRNGGQTSRVKCVSVRSALPIDKQPQPAARRAYVRMYICACMRACVRVSERVHASRSPAGLHSVAQSVLVVGVVSSNNHPLPVVSVRAL